MELSQENSLCIYLKQIMSFFKQNQRIEHHNRSFLGEVVPVGVERRWGKGEGG
jgi:hypothetical protein